VDELLLPPYLLVPEFWYFGAKMLMLVVRSLLVEGLRRCGVGLGRVEVFDGAKNKIPAAAVAMRMCKDVMGYF
jgi:hypothetical protein